MSAPYALAVDRAWLDPDPSDAAAALADELRDIAQRIVTDPRLIDEATGEHCEIEERGAAKIAVNAGDDGPHRAMCRKAAALYALGMYARQHGMPPAGLLIAARRIGWEPVLPGKPS